MSAAMAAKQPERPLLAPPWLGPARSHLPLLAPTVMTAQIEAAPSAAKVA